MNHNEHIISYFIPNSSMSSPDFYFPYASCVERASLICRGKVRLPMIRGCTAILVSEGRALTGRGGSLREAVQGALRIGDSLPWRGKKLQCRTSGRGLPHSSAAFQNWRSNQKIAVTIDRQAAKLSALISTTSICPLGLELQHMLYCNFEHAGSERVVPARSLNRV